MRTLALCLALILPSSLGFGYSGSFSISPPQSRPDLEDLSCNWVVSQVRLTSEKKWQYHLSFRQVTYRPGSVWINSGVSVDGVEVGIAKILVAYNAVLEKDVFLQPDTDYYIRQYSWDGSGRHPQAPDVPFHTPPLPAEDAGGTRVSDWKMHTGDCSPGMASANAHLRLCSLNITDRPLTYAPPFGPAASLEVTYNQREASQTGAAYYANLGPKWGHNWLSFVDEELIMVRPATPPTPEWPPTPADNTKKPPIPALPGAAATPGLPALYDIRATVALPGGGFDRYSESPQFEDGAASAQRFTLANPRDGRIVLAKTSAGYEQRNPDGSKLVYGEAVGSRYFLTQYVDQSGQAVTLAYDASYRIASITDAAGGVTTLGYEFAADPLKITKITDPFGRYATFDYNEAGRLIRITDVIGLKSEFTYNGDFISSLTTPYGTSTFAYGEDSNSRWLTLTDPEGGVERVEYRATLPTVALGGMPTGVLVPQTEDRQRYSLYWSKRASAEKPGDPAAAHLYHWLRGSYFASSGTLMDEKAPLENRVVYNYEGQGAADVEGTSPRVAAKARLLDDGTSQIEKFGYDTFGNLTQYVDPLGRETRSTYDAAGLDLLEVRQKTGTDQYERVAAATYTPQHRPETVTDAAGGTTTFSYNSAGQVRTVTNAKNETTTFWYHPTGQTSDPALDAAAAGYLVRIDGAVAGATTRIVYDAFGRPQTTTDSAGYAVTTEYDTFDRVTKVTYPDGTYRQIVYNRLDPVVVRDRRGGLTRTTYNALRQVQSVTDPLFRVTHFDWCSCGALESLVDPLGHMTSWRYDLQGRVVAKIFRDTTKIQYAYESATSRLKSVTDAAGQVTTWSYFLDDAVKQVSYANATVATPTVSFTYDPNYRRLSGFTDGLGTTAYTYHPAGGAGAGRVAAVDGPLANDTISYTYDELGRVVSRSIDGAANTSSAVFDPLGRVTSLVNPLGTFGLGYVGQTSQPDHVDYPNGMRVNYGYFGNTGDRRLQQIENLGSGGAALSRFGYTYDAEGSIQTMTRQFDATAALTDKFGYDAAQQLTEAVLAAGTGGQKDYVYRYDLAGNRTSEQIGNATTSARHNQVNQLLEMAGSGLIRFEGTVDEPATVKVNGVAAAVDASNRFRADVALAPGNHTVSVVATDGSNNASTRNYAVTVGTGSSRRFTYDVNGNMTDNGAGQTYGWDAANRLVRITQAGTVTEFVYDGLGRRVQEKVNGTLARQWIWADGPQPAEERDAANAVTKRFFSGLGEQIGGSAYTFTTDHLGSVREMADSTGAVRARYDYDPYGRATKVSGDLEADFGFTGFHRHPASGLGLTLFRPYDPNLGRWLSRDPIGENGGINLYGYVLNNSINWIDPLGLASDFHQLRLQSEPGDYLYPGRNPGESFWDFVGRSILTTLANPSFQNSMAFGGPGSNFGGALNQNLRLKCDAERGLARGMGILREAAKGTGNYGLGTATRAEAMKLGEAWVGNGYKVASDGKTLISADGLRQFRPPSPKASSFATTGTQANFEIRSEFGKAWSGNGHLNIVDP